MTSKATWMRRHARQRAEERYGLKLNHVDIARIVDSFGKGTISTFIERQSNDRTVWLVRYNGVEMKAVYSKRHKTLVTILPFQKEGGNS